jgi:hypothetical protein
VYERLYRIYRELYPATRSQMHDLAGAVNTPLGRNIGILEG